MEGSVVIIGGRYLDGLRMYTKSDECMTRSPSTAIIHLFFYT